MVKNDCHQTPSANSTIRPQIGANGRVLHISQLGFRLLITLVAAWLAPVSFPATAWNSAGDTTLDSDTGEIWIVGTLAPDTVTVDITTTNRRRYVRVTWSGLGYFGTDSQSFNFRPTSVERIIFDGGSGDDHFINNTQLPCEVDGGDGDDTLRGGGDEDILLGGSGDDILFGGDGIDHLFGDSGNDQIYGENGGDYIYGYDGNDQLWGGSGVDTISAGAGDDRCWGGNHGDFISGEAGIDRIWGGNGNDDLYGGENTDYLYGNLGDDLLEGENHTDYLYGNDGNDTLRGGRYTDYLFGNAGDDILEGGNGADVLKGDDGADRLYGQNGDDELYGGTGKDGLYGGTGVDLLDGGAARDRLLYHLDEGTDDLVWEDNENDIVVLFIDGNRVLHEGSWYESAEWEPEYIEIADAELHPIHMASTNLLLREGEWIRIYIHGGKTSGSSSSPAWNNGDVHVRTKGFKDGVIDPLIHEIGHNWDELNPKWDEWLEMSGWEKSRSQPSPNHTQTEDAKNWWYDASIAEFMNPDQVNGYARDNPFEDFACHFAAHILDQDNIKTNAPNKDRFLAQFIYDLGN